MNPNRRITGAAFLTSLVLAGSIVTAHAPAGAHDTGGHDPVAPHAAELTAAQRQVIREATHQFRDVDVAVAAGYLPTDHCTEEPALGGMGHHFVNPALIGDGQVDPTAPEILLYAPGPRGELRLVGVEYMTVDADQDLGTDGDRPTLMGHPFEGPMPGHEPGMPVHYDLHAWVFTHNPSGNLATWNPKLTCSDG